MELQLNTLLKESAYQEMFENEALYRALFEQTNDAVFIASLDFVFVKVNQQAADMLGYELEDLVGMTIQQVVALDDGNNRTQLTDSSGGILPIYERNYRRKDGSTLPVEVSTTLVQNPDGKPVLIQNIVRDITRRKRAEVALRQSEARNKAIVDAIPDLICRITHTGKFLDYIAHESHPLFLPRESVINRFVHDVMPENIADQILENVEKTLISRNLHFFEYQLEDDPRTYEARLDISGNKEVIVIIRDVSDKVRLEQMKSDFINRASHELRTPVTTSILMTDLIREGGSEEELEDYWKILASELNRQRILIDRFLIAGRLESNMLVLNMASLKLKPLIDDSIMAVKPIAKKKGVTINFEDPPYIPNILADTHGLQQVFINLLNNAVKFSPENGNIIIEVLEKDAGVSVLIRDEGLGIPDEALSDLFRRFYRAKNVTIAEIPGSGVGLYIVKSLIEEMGGKISVESKVGQGTTFEVWIQADLDDYAQKVEENVNELLAVTQ
ncbi:MAG: PAS domain S-box protein [Chloroflexi bacterium]|nr:PAS domain S-box protein [Chloroflexota bacterium]